MDNLQTLRDYLNREAALQSGLHLRKGTGPLTFNDIFIATYGKKVWDTLQSQTRFWNLVGAVAWGQDTGWRLRSGRAGTTRPLQDGAALPTPGHSDYERVDAPPKSYVTPISVGALAQETGNMAGSIGDILAQEQQWARNDHRMSINQSLIAPAALICIQTGGGAGVSGTPKVYPYKGLQIGSKIKFYDRDESDYEERTLTAISATGELTWSEAGGKMTAGDSVIVVSRDGFTSIDECVEHKGRTLPGSMSTDIPVYDIDADDRDEGGWAAAGVVIDNDGDLDEYSNDMLDEAIREIRDRGGEPDLILTGSTTRDVINGQLAANQRFMEVGDFKVKIGDETTLPGHRGGFEISTYKGIPIFAEPDMWTCCEWDGELKTGIEPIYILDTSDILVRIAVQTRYLESRDLLVIGALAYEGIFWTAGELQSRTFHKQGKIVDIKAPAGD